jgi:hypothetical protein
MSGLAGGGLWWLGEVADGDGALGVLCYGAFRIAAGREWRGWLGDGADADPAFAAGYQHGQYGGFGFGQGLVRAGPREGQGAADGMQGGGEGDPVRVDAGAGGGQGDDGADGLVDDQVGPQFLAG